MNDIEILANIFSKANAGRHKGYLLILNDCVVEAHQWQGEWYLHDEERDKILYLEDFEDFSWTHGSVSFFHGGKEYTLLLVKIVNLR